MSTLSLEIVEGPGAGTQVALDRPLLIGRAEDADLVLSDSEVSRHHARVSPSSDGAAIVEDLGSSNGTFLNHRELQLPARLIAGDELLIGVTLVELRSAAQVAAQPSAVRAVPPALAIAERRPDYVDPVAAAPGVPKPGLNPELEQFRDARVRFQARTAPLAFFVLVALVVAIYLAAN
jgi:pSer/pThr/pTyr-binding forkhead associated (FHA) protein